LLFNFTTIRRVPRQRQIEVFKFVENIPIRRILEYIGQIFIWIEPVFFRGFDNAEYNRARFRASRGIRKKPVFLPIIKGLMLSSARLLLISSLPSSRYRSNVRVDF
jgi:hypothetical protein